MMFYPVIRIRVRYRWVDGWMRGWVYKISGSELGDVEFAVADHPSAPEFVLQAPAHFGQQDLLNLTDANLFLQILTLVEVRQLVTHLRQPVREHPFVHPAQQLLVLQEQFQQPQLVHCLELINAPNVPDVHHGVARVSHRHFPLDRPDAVQKPLLEFGVVDFDLSGFLFEGRGPPAGGEGPYFVLVEGFALVDLSLFYFFVEPGDFCIFCLEGVL